MLRALPLQAGKTTPKKQPDPATIWFGDTVDTALPPSSRPFHICSGVNHTWVVLLDCFKSLILTVKMWTNPWEFICVWNFWAENFIGIFEICYCKIASLSHLSPASPPPALGRNGLGLDWEDPPPPPVHLPQNGPSWIFFICHHPTPLSFSCNPLPITYSPACLVVPPPPVPSQVGGPLSPTVRYPNFQGNPAPCLRYSVEELYIVPSGYKSSWICRQGAPTYPHQWTCPIFLVYTNSMDPVHFGAYTVILI